MVFASALSLHPAYKASVFSEINPLTPIFFIKILPMKRSSDSHQSDFRLHQFLF